VRVVTASLSCEKLPRQFGVVRFPDRSIILTLLSVTILSATVEFDLRANDEPSVGFSYEYLWDGLRFDSCFDNVTN